MAEVTPATRALLDDPPEVSEWLALEHNVDLFVAWERVAGTAVVRAMAYEAARDSISKYVRPVIELSLSAFGASPATVLGHADLFLRFYIRGQKVTFAPAGPKGGTVEIRVSGLRPPRIFFEVWAGIAEHGVELCGAHPTVTVGRVGETEDGADGLGMLDVTWA